MRKSESIDLIGQAFVLSVAAIIQVSAFTFTYEGIVEMYEIFFRRLNPVFGFGPQFTSSLYLMGILAAINSIVFTCMKPFEIRWISAMAATAIWAIFWVNISPVVPNRFFLIVLAGMLSFHIGILFCDVLLATGRTKRSLR